MTITVLLILAVLWAAVLVPPVLRNRSENRRGEPIGPLNLRAGSKRPRPSLGSAFNSPSPGGAFRPAAFPSRPLGPAPANGVSSRPPVMSPAQRRRRDVLVILVGAVGVSLVLAFFTGVLAIWLLHLLADALLAGYVFLLVRMKQRGGVAAGRGALPPPIPLEHSRQARHVPHRELALRRSATS